MNRMKICMMSASILALTAASGTAFAQNRAESPRHSVRIAERSAQMETSLAEAIALAEKHTKGVVIGIRLSTNKNTFVSDANGLRDFRDRAWGEEAPAYGRSDRESDDRAAADRRDNMPTTREQTTTRDSTTTRDQTTTRDSTTTRDTTTTRDANRDNARRDRDNLDRTADEWQTNMPDSRDQSLSQTSDTPVFAIVTCVIDRARVRDVVIDMADGSVLGMQSVHASAGQQGTWGDSSQGMWGSSQGMQAGQGQFALVRASEMMNATARNADGQRVGDIDELVINPDTNRVVYGVLRRGGFLGINESRYAVSTSELTVPRDGNIRLNLSSRDFEGHDGFEDSKWPKQADQQWSTGWTSDAEKTQPAARILKATDLIGTNVLCSDGQSMGEIGDLIVEPRSGRVVYAIVESNRGDVVVPMSVLQTKGEDRVMKMTHAEAMKLPTLDAGSDPDWSDARWNRRIHDNYNARMDLTSAPTDHGRP